jgi:crotonobetainyl-CoA:carnitine CoA-transferase CaiB-like acyl-CoA transferase
MLDAGVAFLWPDGMMQHSLLDSGAVVTGPHMADNYLVRRTADGHLALMAYSERQFPGLCRALGKPEWLDDPRFVSLADRDANTAALNDLVAAEIELRVGAELVDALHAQDVPCAMITPIDRVHLDPQVQHNQVIVEHERPHLGRVREARPPAQFSTTPTSLGRHAPKLDEHTDEVLAELGFTAADIDELRARAIVGPKH